MTFCSVVFNNRFTTCVRLILLLKTPPSDETGHQTEKKKLVTLLKTCECNVLAVFPPMTDGCVRESNLSPRFDFLQSQQQQQQSPRDAVFFLLRFPVYPRGSGSNSICFGRRTQFRTQCTLFSHFSTPFFTFLRRKVLLTTINPS